MSSAKTRVSELWKDYSNGPLPAQTEHVEQTPNKRHKSSLFDLDDVIESHDDEYQRWCQRPRERFSLESPPLEFWTSYAIKKIFSRLQKMALVSLRCLMNQKGVDDETTSITAITEGYCDESMLKKLVTTGPCYLSDL
ncbi:hypothetical protein E4T52_14741 [Aureobasidium sp. EXF-3400]|nr:hypothetical protein E4T51_15378 [Aureobasidium sp. EXF-12344]KAI4770235.1 hypothetical protein E4T52_14741 [Aureobasidium sp. EXF-3400]